MLIDKAEIERVKRAQELVSFIRSRGVSLTQRGKQLVGLCPFHDDHEPSLMIDARKQLWNCLGACHEGGDVSVIFRCAAPPFVIGDEVGTGDSMFGGKRKDSNSTRQ